MDTEPLPPLDAAENHSPALDDGDVLGVLESGVADDEQATRVTTGIRNGVLIGASLWAAALLGALAFGWL